MEDENILEQGCVDVAELARVLSIGKTTAYRLLDSGTIPSIKIGTIRRVPVRWLMEFVESQIQKAVGRSLGTDGD